MAAKLFILTLLLRQNLAFTLTQNEENVNASASTTENGCGIYPPCSQYGQGEWQILEDCHRYIRCTYVNGELKQENLECEGDLVFAEEYGRCVDYDMATDCKSFQQTVCLASCPRVTLTSSGNALDHQSQRLGCFRISGTTFGGTLPHYRNEYGQYLSPDAMSTPLSIHWLVSESYSAFNGGIRNNKYDYIRCPFTDWNDGWQADIGLGNWVDDPTFTVTCHRGSDTGSTTTSVRPTGSSSSSATTPTTSTTSGNSCHKNDCNAIGVCVADFLCCKYDVGSQSYTSVSCRCNDGFIFDEELRCIYPDMAGCFEKNMTQPETDLWAPADHTCDDGSLCECTDP